MPDPDFPIRLRDDGSVDHDFYRGEAARMRVEERRRLFRLVWLQALRAVRRGQRAATQDLAIVR